MSENTKTDTRPSCETVKGVREDPTYVRSECPFLYANRKNHHYKWQILTLLTFTVSHLKYSLKRPKSKV